jgi:RHS repeat-associated protein
MKLKNCILPALCAMAVFSQTSRASLQATLPEFKSKQALQAQAASRQVQKEEASGSIFYTGKPFEAQREGYLFKYRSYDAKLNRWTSADPSGFPEGPNNALYGPSAPTGGFDALGLSWHFTGSNSSGSLTSGLTYSQPIDLHGTIAGSYNITGFSNGEATSLTMNIVASNSVDGWFADSNASLNATITFTINPTSGEVTMSGTTKDDDRGYAFSVGSVNAAYNLGIEDKKNVVQGAIAFGYLYKSGSANLSIGFKGSGLEVGVEIPVESNWSKDPTLSFSLAKAE